MEIDFLKIPKDRIAVLIGASGDTKKTIEKQTKTELEINSATGDVTVTKKKGGNDTDFLKSVSIVKAIARGFSPEHALLLLNDDFYLEVINLIDYIGKDSKQLMQKKGRVIGKKGAIRKDLEETTNTYISVYGKTISVMGKLEGIEIAKQAIEMLIQGSSHDTVKGFLKRKTSFGEAQLQL
ncbi:MAG TPA: KH domain-containing protein [archaeon]|nr:KH domain-containing protein [archaeon]